MTLTRITMAAGVPSVIAKAATAAGVRRLAEVVPVRTEALRARLPDLAAALASEPDFVSARANIVRERCARAMLTREDTVVPATPLIAALVAAALATLKDRRVTKWSGHRKAVLARGDHTAPTRLCPGGRRWPTRALGGPRQELFVGHVQRG